MYSKLKGMTMKYQKKLENNRANNFRRAKTMETMCKTGKKEIIVIETKMVRKCVMVTCKPHV